MSTPAKTPAKSPAKTPGVPLRAVLLVRCADRRGLVRDIAEFIFAHGGNILHADHHIDFDSHQFFSRVEWELAEPVAAAELEAGFQPLARAADMEWELHLSSHVPTVAIFVSRQDHCLTDLLHRWSLGEMPGRVAAVLSNHPDLRQSVERHEVPYHCFPITLQNKRVQEGRELELLKQLGVELLIFARYMQVVTPDFINQYPNRIISIHHSFLPAFVGAAPYARAYQRGVKFIGATAHYVSEVLDAGPIIEQDLSRVSHRDTLEDFIRKGRDLERIVLARAVRLHLARRVLPYANKTVVFD